MNKMKRQIKNLREALDKVRMTSDRTNLLTPDPQKKTHALEAKVGVLASQTPTETPWELASDKETTEVD